jgi:magnesium transporter
MNDKLITAHVDDDQETVARMLARYDLLALPIVDDDQRLVGVVTADDVIDVLEEEATEDIYHLANLQADEDVYDSVWRSSRRRLTWLGLNLPTALFAAWVVTRFELTLEAVPVLAGFALIVNGQSGNAGIQTLTLIVRSLALGELSLRDSWRTLAREFAIGGLNGIIFGLLLGVIGLVWQGSFTLGMVVGAALLLNLINAALAGTLVPLGLRLLRVDPALASGVLVTTFTDVMGSLCLYGLATLILL